MGTFSHILCAGTLASLPCVCLFGADIEYHIPEAQFKNKTLYAGNGFVFEAKNLNPDHGITGFSAIGEALKLSHNERVVFATGNVQLTVPETNWQGGRSLVITCDDLHYDLDAGTAIANNASFNWYTGNRRYRITCATLTIAPNAITAHEAIFHGAHGSIMEMSSKEIVIGLIPPDRPERAHGRLEDITMWQPTFRMGGVPVFWLPVLYRDFTRDYPWTRYEFGYSKRQKGWIDGWIGSTLPRFLGFSGHAQARYSYYDNQGSGYGLGWYYSHALLGMGGITWFRMPNEQVFDQDGRTLLEERDAQALDWEHQAKIKNVSLYARYSDLPDASALDEELDTNEQFRADYLADDLKYKPLARQGVTASWASSYVALVADTEYQPNDERTETERELGLQASTPVISILGPLHVSGQAWYENFVNSKARQQIL